MKCCLFSKPGLSFYNIHSNFIKIENLINTQKRDYILFKCKHCNCLFLFEYVQNCTAFYLTFVQVKSKEHAISLMKKDDYYLKGIKPSIFIDIDSPTLYLYM